jgi:hypothetical protein
MKMKETFYTRVNIMYPGDLSGQLAEIRELFRDRDLTIEEVRYFSAVCVNGYLRTHCNGIISDDLNRTIVMHFDKFNPSTHESFKKYCTGKN